MLLPATLNVPVVYYEACRFSCGLTHHKVLLSEGGGARSRPAVNGALSAGRRLPADGQWPHLLSAVERAAGEKYTQMFRY